MTVSSSPPFPTGRILLLSLLLSAGLLLMFADYAFLLYRGVELRGGGETSSSSMSTVVSRGSPPPPCTVPVVAVLDGELSPSNSPCIRKLISLSMPIIVAVVPAPKKVAPSLPRQVAVNVLLAETLSAARRQAIQMGACMVWQLRTTSCPNDSAMRMVSALISGNMQPRVSAQVWSPKVGENDLVIRGVRRLYGDDSATTTNSAFPRLRLNNDGPERRRIRQTIDVLFMYNVYNDEYQQNLNSALESLVVAVHKRRLVDLPLSSALLSARAMELLLTMNGGNEDSLVLQYLCQRYFEDGVVAITAASVRVAEGDRVEVAAQLDTHFVEQVAERMGLHKVTDLLPLPPSPPPVNIAAAVQFNKGFRRLIPTWLAIHGHEFKEVRMYVPNALPCTRITGFHVYCLSDDERGYFAYEAAVHSVREASAHIEGVVFLHDDAVWRRGLMHRLNTNISHYPENSGAVPWQRPAPGERQGWTTWWLQPSGYEASKKLLARMGIPHEQMTFYHGQSDEFYVARRDFQVFLRMGTQMLINDTKVFLEVAIPTIYQSFFTNPVNNWRLRTVFGKGPAMKRAERLAQWFCDDKSADFVHPIKTSSMVGVLAKLKAAECA